jgi:hypothetical protein
MNQVLLKHDKKPYLTPFSIMYPLVWAIHLNQMRCDLSKSEVSFRYWCLIW